jgi:hypothetical protein
MRWYFKVMVAVLLGWGALEVGQSRAQIGGGGFGRMGKGDSNPLSLLQNQSVKKELRLTDEQAAKVSDAVWKALAEVLDPDQLRRLKQIDLQQRDYQAFGDIRVQEALKLNAEQKDSIKTILADADREMADARKEITGGNFQAAMEKMTSIGRETKDRCQSVLNKNQRRLWNEMLGDEFKMEFPRFDFKGKKKDA